MSRLPPHPARAPRSADRRARGLRAPAFAAGAALASIVLLAGGCAPLPPAPPNPSLSPFVTASPATPAGASASPAAPTGAAAGPGLLLLAEDGRGAALFLVRLSGEVVPLPVPDPAVVAVAPTAGGGLLAVLRDGSAFDARGGPASLLAGAAWRPVTISGSGEMPPGAVIWSATSSPDGTRVAAVARPPDAEAPSALAILKPAVGRREILPLADQSEGTAPAWVDEARVALLQRDARDQIFVAVVDVASGRTTDRLPIRAFDSVTSRDGTTWAFVVDDRVFVGPTAAVLAKRRIPDGGPPMPAADRVSGGIALSGDGRALAVAVEEGDPGASRIAIYERDGGPWRATTRIAPPVSASGGWLSWLP